MGNRSFLFVGVVVILISANFSDAEDICWHACYSKATTLCEKGEWSAAYQQATQALDQAGNKFAHDPLKMAKSLEKLSEICQAWGRQQQSMLFLNRALTIRTRLHGKHHPSVIKLLTAMADQHRKHGQYEPAGRLYRRALDCAEKGGWGESSNAAPALEGLGRLYMDQGDNARAEDFCQRALSLYEIGQKYRPSEKLCAARVMMYLAEINRGDRNFPQAAQFYKTALDKYLVIAGPRCPMIPLIYTRLGELHLEWKKPSLAVTNFNRALGAHDKTGFPEFDVVAAALAGLATAMKCRDDATAAKPLMDRAEAIYTRSAAPDNELATRVLLKKARIWPTLSKQ
jgi:tetratricopeptide (TPR) repeat protein